MTLRYSLSTRRLCCLCDSSAVDDRPGAPLCKVCGERCKKQAEAASSKPTVVALCSDPADLLQRHHARLLLSGQEELASFVGVAAIGGAPKGITVQ